MFFHCIKKKDGCGFQTSFKSSAAPKKSHSLTDIRRKTKTIENLCFTCHCFFFFLVHPSICASSISSWDLWFCFCDTKKKIYHQISKANLTFSGRKQKIMYACGDWNQYFHCRKNIFCLLLLLISLVLKVEALKGIFLKLDFDRISQITPRKYSCGVSLVSLQF